MSSIPEIVTDMNGTTAPIDIVIDMGDCIVQTIWANDQTLRIIFVDNSVPVAFPWPVGGPLSAMPAEIAEAVTKCCLDNAPPL